MFSKKDFDSCLRLQGVRLNSLFSTTINHECPGDKKKVSWTGTVLARADVSAQPGWDRHIGT